MNNKLENKVVLITGASRGVGACLARDFAKEKARVVINYNNSESEAAVVAKEVASLGGTPLLIKADVSSYQEVKNMFDIIKKTFGTVDVLVNNAGVCDYSLMCDITPETLDKMVDVNLKGVLYCSKEASLIMLSNQKGKIINISSIWGEVGAANEVTYSATKAGVIGLTKALAKELEYNNIQVNAVAPATVVNTGMTKNLTQETLEELKEESPNKRLLTTKDVSEIVLFLASEKGDKITGEVISLR